MKKLDFKVLLPNVITLSGLSFGLSSIRFALESDFNLAIVCILFAGVCDVLDGMLARHLQSESDLGAQLDSLSDFLSFGIAPGILMYMSIFNQDSRIGAFAALAFIIFSCLILYPTFYMCLVFHNYPSSLVMGVNYKNQKMKHI